MSGWGNVWIGAIVRLYPEAKGRPTVRGRGYLRAGRVLDVRVEGGTVRAKVIGYRRVPYAVVIRVRPIASDVWQAASRLIVGDHRCADALRHGVLLPEIADHFEAAGDALIPQDAYAVTMQCDCPRPGETCEHIMGVHLWIADAVERDSVLLFTLRGGSAGAVAFGTPSTALLETPVPHAIAGTTAGTSYQLLGPEATGAAFDRWRGVAATLPPYDGTSAPPDQLLAQLGDPPGWDGIAKLHETLAPVYHGAARWARALLLGKAEH